MKTSSFKTTIMTTILLYSAEITEELFNQAIKVLEGRGFGRDEGLANTYSGFKTYGGLGWWDGCWMTVVRRRRIEGEKYVTIHDLLGYSFIPDLVLVDYQPNFSPLKQKTTVIQVNTPIIIHVPYI